MPKATTAKVWDLASLLEGQTVSVEFTVTTEDMAQFAALSGDYNPLHCDADFAHSRGFEGRVVYGALLLAKVSRLIGMDLPGRDSLWLSTDMQFAAPLILGQPAMIKASISQISLALRTVELKVRIQSGKRLIARGKALVSMQHGG